MLFFRDINYETVRCIFPRQPSNQPASPSLRICKICNLGQTPLWLARRSTLNLQSRNLGRIPLQPTEQPSVCGNQQICKSCNMKITTPQPASEPAIIRLVGKCNLRIRSLHPSPPSQPSNQLHICRNRNLGSTFLHPAIQPAINNVKLCSLGITLLQPPKHPAKSLICTTSDLD